MNNDDVHITARSVLEGTKVDLYFKSIEDAAQANPGLTDFEYKGALKLRK